MGKPEKLCEHMCAGAEFAKTDFADLVEIVEEEAGGHANCAIIGYLHGTAMAAAARLGNKAVIDALVAAASVLAVAERAKSGQQVDAVSLLKHPARH